MQTTENLDHQNLVVEGVVEPACGCAPTRRMVGNQACAVCKMAKLAGDENRALNVYVSLNQFHLMFWVG